MSSSPSARMSNAIKRASRQKLILFSFIIVFFAGLVNGEGRRFAVLRRPCHFGVQTERLQRRSKPSGPFVCHACHLYCGSPSAVTALARECAHQKTPPDGIVLPSGGPSLFRKLFTCPRRRSGYSRRPARPPGPGTPPGRPSPAGGRRRAGRTFPRRCRSPPVWPRPASRCR